MKIVFASSEAAPYIKTGGLGDVAGALPTSLSKIKGNEIFLFIPYYSKIKNNPEIETEFIKSFYVDLSWRKQHVGIFKLKSKRKKLQVYFIDNEYYFSRSNIYGEADDGERFAYFSKAILESLVKLGINPDIIHSNDWQTALIPVFYNAFYRDSFEKSIKTVFTIHNIEYQGKADPYFIGDTLGLGPEYESTVIFDNCVNFMKSAILKSDAVTTVSKTYSEEIKYPYFAHGLSSVICDHAFKLYGVTNGIDTEKLNPETDKNLFFNYSSDTFENGKKSNKEELQKMLGLEINKDKPMVAMVSRLVSHKGLDLVVREMYSLMDWDIQLVILGTGDRKYENLLRECADSNRNKFSLILDFNSSLAQKIYASSDIFLMPSKSEPCGLSQLIAMRYGSVPIVNSTGGLKDTVLPFDKSNKNGHGFTFQSFNSQDMLGSLRRALEIFGGDKESWKICVKNAMEYDSSWNVPAKEYMDLYNKLI